MEAASKDEASEVTDKFQESGKISVSVQEISKESTMISLSENPISSPPVFVKNVPWVFTVGARKKKKQWRLEAKLKCDLHSDLLWSCIVAVDIHPVRLHESESESESDGKPKFYGYSNEAVHGARESFPWPGVIRKFGLDDILTLVADLQVTAPHFDHQLNNDFAVLYKEQNWSDIVVCVAGTDFKAHKVVLGARSGYFRGLLQSEMSEQLAGKVILEDVDSEAFELLLRFIYCGTIELRELDFAMHLKLLCLADRLLVEPFKNYYFLKLKSDPDLDVKEVTDGMLVAAQINCHPLKLLCMRGFKEVIDSGEFGEMELGELEDLAKLDQLPDVRREMLEVVESAMDKFDTESCMIALILAHRYGREELKKKCLLRLKDKPKEMIESRPFTELDKNSELHRELLISLAQSYSDRQ